MVMMKKNARCDAHFALGAALVLLVLVMVPETGAVTCSVTELTPCAAAIMASSPPSAVCCQKLREQKPCLCGYLRSPVLRPYVNSPNARKVSSRCNIPFPNC